jgi:hypothetical protein
MSGTRRAKVLVLGPSARQLVAIQEQCHGFDIRGIEVGHGYAKEFDARWDLVVLMLRNCSHNAYQKKLSAKTKVVLVPSGGISEVVRVIHQHLAVSAVKQQKGK